MKSSKMYAAIAVEENGKYYAYVIPFTSSDNALHKLAPRGVKHANIYPTKKAAAEVVNDWNAAYKHNGTFLFGETF